MGAAVTFVMALASAFCYLINLVLVPLNLAFMQTVAYILVIAGLVQFVEMFLKKNIPHPVYRPRRVPAPDHDELRRAGCRPAEHAERLQLHRVRGIRHHRRLGFLLAIFLFAAVREQLEVSSETPKAFEASPSLWLPPA